MGITGFRGFTVVWFGQMVSFLGTAMTRFAMTIWAYQQTESATAMALVAFFGFAPMIIMTPIAGALADRWNRKLVMIASDTGAGLATVFLLLLYSSGNLEIWHLYVAGTLGGISEAFQFPAFSAAITMMVDKKHYTRVSGMQSLAQSISTIAAPMLAVIVLTKIGINGVMLFDVFTFLVAIFTLSLVYIPQPKVTKEGRESRGNLRQESLFGFQYIWKRPSLLGLQMMFFMLNLFATMATVLLAPMILGSLGDNETGKQALASVEAMMGVGGLLGGLLLTTWGGPRKRVNGVLLGMFFSSLLGQMVIGIGQGVAVWSLGAFMMSFFIPMINGSNQAIWQTKVPPDLQGKVFAVRRLIAQVTAPVGMLIAGPLADYVFEPGMKDGGWLAATFGGIVGTGTGSGIALIFFFTGIFAAIAAASGYLIPAIRNAETILPDYEAIPEPIITEEVIPEGIPVTASGD